MRSASEVLAVAAVVYDQDGPLNDADTAFLDAIANAGLEWSEALTAANKNFGGGSEGWWAVKRLATRQRDAAYAAALAALEAHDGDELFQLAAE